jgi:O-antigen/teichoic acid export membrane protein
MAINSVIGNAIAASGRMWHGFGINLVWLLIFLGGSFALIPKWGATGLAVCFASSYLVLTATVWYYTRNFLEIRYERANILICISLSVVGIGFLTSFSAPGVLRFALNSLVLFVLLLIEIKWLLNGAEKSFIWSVLTWK